MKCYHLLFASLLLATLSLSTASAGLMPECDSTAVLIDSGTFSVTVYLGASSQGGGTQTGGEYFQYYVSGDTVLVINPGTISFAGLCPGLDNSPASLLFDQISTAVTEMLVEDLDIPTSSSCTQPATTAVMIPTCVLRIGSGAATTFTNVNPCNQSTRTVEHCLVNGVASAGIVSTSDCTSCSTGEGTCSDSVGSGIE